MTVAAIVDASSLIILAKLQAIEALYKTYGPLGMTPAVYQEAVVRGKLEGWPDALVIEAAIGHKLITVLKLTPEQQVFVDHLRRTGQVYGVGECESIACAKDLGTLLVVEERKGRVVARTYGISYVVLQVFPLQGYIGRRLSYKQCVNLLDQIAVAMNSDLAIVATLKSAAEAIRVERGEENVQQSSTA